ncbi:MAG: HIT family protein [Candidatus Hydrogenedentes bacterium]|nr:HIT family protein [Candidatus Hydrogenedentota bacterium]MBI3117561.1 HIT family protein [Candidatus Hydrogenedentota bacterium]
MLRKPCVFCEIGNGRAPALLVLEERDHVAFLDHRPLLHGHVLLVPRRHVETFLELGPEEIGAVYGLAQRLARALETGLSADGSFLAVNTRISQSVPHFHIHIVPRWKNDGLFSPKLVWKRRPYASDAEAEEVAAKIRCALKREE